MYTDANAWRRHLRTNEYKALACKVGGCKEVKEFSSMEGFRNHMVIIHHQSKAQVKELLDNSSDKKWSWGYQGKEFAYNAVLWWFWRQRGRKDLLSCSLTFFLSTIISICRHRLGSLLCSSWYCLWYIAYLCLLAASQYLASLHMMAKERKPYQISIWCRQNLGSKVLRYIMSQEKRTELLYWLTTRSR